MIHSLNQIVSKVNHTNEYKYFNHSELQIGYFSLRFLQFGWIIMNDFTTRRVIVVSPVNGWFVR